MGIDKLYGEGFEQPEDRPIPFWFFKESEKPERKREPLAVGQRSIGTYTIISERNRTGYSVKVRDEISGRIVAKSTSQDIYDARRKFDRACELARGQE